MPLASVIIPTRNRPAALARALDAIARQTHPDLEIVVYDDGSMAEARREYVRMAGRLGSRFRFITETPPGSAGQGPSAARNRAIALASGELIAFCDDDDEWTADDHIAAAAAAFAQRPQADMFFADQLPVMNGTPSHSTWWPGLDIDELRSHRIGASDLYLPPLALLLSSGAFAHLNITVARRALIERIGGFWHRAYYEEDLNFYWRALDRSGGVIFRASTVAKHHVPDRSKQDNASTRMDEADRLLGRLAICAHARTQVRTSSVLAAIGAVEGYALRRLALAAVQDGCYRRAFRTAALALAAKPSLKWLIYSGYLGIRAAIAEYRQP